MPHPSSSLFALLLSVFLWAIHLSTFRYVPLLNLLRSSSRIRKFHPPSNLFISYVLQSDYLAASSQKSISVARILKANTHLDTSYARIGFTNSTEHFLSINLNGTTYTASNRTPARIEFHLDFSQEDQIRGCGGCGWHHSKLHSEFRAGADNKYPIYFFFVISPLYRFVYSLLNLFGYIFWSQQSVFGQLAFVTFSFKSRFFSSITMYLVLRKFILKTLVL